MRSALVSVSMPHSTAVAIDAPALDRLPLRDDPSTGFGLRRVMNGGERSAFRRMRR
jgi:hypothetical protein